MLLAKSECFCELRKPLLGLKNLGFLSYPRLVNKGRLVIAAFRACLDGRRSYWFGEISMGRFCFEYMVNEEQSEGV